MDLTFVIIENNSWKLFERKKKVSSEWLIFQNLLGILSISFQSPGVGTRGGAITYDEDQEGEYGGEREIYSCDEGITIVYINVYVSCNKFLWIL